MRFDGKEKAKRAVPNTLHCNFETKNSLRWNWPALEARPAPLRQLFGRQECPFDRGRRK